MAKCTDMLPDMGIVINNNGQHGWMWYLWMDAEKRRIG